ncbi:MAG: helix-turn-helix transcriptional regulator [Burkholderiales bacterium]|nr:helix-turn-helix transcriptional regulator [Burkholderiales bacterium]
MRRTSFSDMSCPIARSLDLIGEWWSLLIIREAFWGTRRFGEFEAHLGIAPNVLTQRLARLVEGGILEVVSESQNGRALEYRLSPKGVELSPVLVALAQWGDRNLPRPEGPATRIVERATGQDVAPITVMSASGHTLRPKEIAVVAGPGADPKEREQFAKARAKRAQRTPAA